MRLGSAPAYLSLLVLGDDNLTSKVAVGRALTATASITVDFAALFGVFGLVIQPVAGQVQAHLPWFTIAFRILMGAAGAWLLAGRRLPALLPKVRRAPTVTRSVPSMALLGMATALPPWAAPSPLSSPSSSPPSAAAPQAREFSYSPRTRSAWGCSSVSRP
ncbi:hypothetical protein ACFT7S_06370 [Streptomyces sp. NPDC057136]|uniref:hypothetical protein n=1 Tax=Streptomyces sp. NPDC057136 TaxID=3346029 RepID=UPI003642B724